MAKRKRTHYRTRFSPTTVKIVPLIKERAMSAKQLAEAIGCDVRHVTQAIHRERKCAVEPIPIYIASWGWVTVGKWTSWSPLYRYGRKPDAKEPAPRPKRPVKVYPAKALTEAIEAALEERGQPMSAIALQRHLQKNMRAVRDAIKVMRADGRIHIGRYSRELQPGRRIRRPVMEFALGPGRDARHPGPVPLAEQSRRQREKRGRFVSSVFQLGVPQYQKRLGSRVIPS